jgi:hypothetical protein
VTALSLLSVGLKVLVWVVTAKVETLVRTVERALGREKQRRLLFVPAYSAGPSLHSGACQ